MRARLPIVIALVVLASAGAAWASAVPARPVAEEAYVVLLRLRWDLYAQWKETGRWPADSAANAALGGHVRYWDEQRRAGRAILAGGMKGEYWDNVALIVFRARSQAEADSVVRQDPAVRAHVFQSQVRGFDVSWIGSATPPP
ncbi:MAG TPA: YciI family protein [Longimicrobium sp.]|nr:YciI family protein [Longimicrobium sp.]